MKFSFRYIKKISVVFLTFFSFSLSAEIPEGYYQSAEGKTGAELKTALHNIIRQHIILNYDTSTYVWWYTYFKATDWHPDGYFWDMYSNNKRSTYNGNLMNREHCMPRSWWGTSSNYSTFDANGDLVNLSPSDAEANTAKSNYPLGVVGSSVIYTNGVVKVGNNTYTGYNGVVFEPQINIKAILQELTCIWLLVTKIINRTGEEPVLRVCWTEIRTLYSNNGPLKCCWSGAGMIRSATRKPIGMMVLI